MTENKRFEIIKSAIIDGARVIKDNENKYTFATTFETATLVNYRKALNELNDKNEQLAKEKERYKRLSEIRREEINNRILTIKEFIENCSDNKVKSVLKELFYSEVNEYDLFSENRKLLHENEKLKSKNRGLQSELQIFKEDATHSNLQINKLADENEQLKQYVQSSKKFTKEVEDFFQKCDIDTVNFSILENLIDADNLIYFR